MNINELGQILTTIDLRRKFFLESGIDEEDFYKHETLEFDYNLQLVSDEDRVYLISSLIFQLESENSFAGIRWVLELVIKGNKATIMAYPHLTYSDFPNSVRLKNIYSYETLDGEGLIEHIIEARDELMKKLISNLQDRTCRDLWTKEQEAAKERVEHLPSIKSLQE